jgi:hypothetical protein
VRSFGQVVKLCATNRRAPASRAAASRWSVPSVRSRFVTAKSRSNFFGLPVIAPSAVSWWTTTSGFASATAVRTLSASSPSMTTPVTPCVPRRASPASFRLVPNTSCPAVTSSGPRRLPSAPVAPAMKIFMAVLLRHPVRRNGLDACDNRP